jgi:Tfp pilus assembly protein PilN
LIEVNLLPGSVKRAKRRKGKGIALSMPGLPGMPPMDRITAFTAASFILAPLALAWMFLGTRAKIAEIDESIETAVQDSTRYAQVIAANASLTARRDTIGQRLNIIQSIDEARFIWPHVMDEISRALPEFTWLTALSQTQPGPTPAFQISGQTGNNLALTKFMTQLEASPFITGVRLSQTNLLPPEQTGNRLVYEFVLEAMYEKPSADAIETVPLFGDRQE